MNRGYDLNDPLLQRHIPKAGKKPAEHSNIGHAGGTAVALAEPDGKRSRSDAQAYRTRRAGSGGLGISKSRTPTSSESHQSFDIVSSPIGRLLSGILVPSG